MYTSIILHSQHNKTQTQLAKRGCACVRAHAIAQSRVLLAIVTICLAISKYIVSIDH